MLFRGALSSLQKQLAVASASSSSSSSGATTPAVTLSSELVAAAVVVLVTASFYGAESSNEQRTALTLNDGENSGDHLALAARGAASPSSALFSASPSASQWRARGNNNNGALCQAAKSDDNLQQLQSLAALKQLDLSAATTKKGGGVKQPYGIDVVLGSQWGDEGKGKLVDILSQEYDVCARVAGGSNAGHTIVVDGIKYKFHLLPSGILNTKAICVVGNGVVIHLPSFLDEIDTLNKTLNGGTSEEINVDRRILLSDRAHIVFDFHQEVDGVIENRLGRNKIGTTKKGIGPAYASKISRNGIRVGDLQNMEYFEMRFRELAAAHLRAFPGLEIDIESQLSYYRSIAKRISAMTTDTIEFTNEAYASGKRILIEGANATMLDIDFGTYPYVTSSNPSIGSVLTGLGVSPKKIHGIYGTTKAYCTRVGEGPFPTELERDVPGSIGEHLGLVGAEWGTTTGRARRVGWIDVPQMRYSTMINGFTALNLTKLDVLTGLKEVKIGRAYNHNGIKIYTMPSCLKTMSEIEVVYETLPGWTEDISQAKNFDDLPENAQHYVLRIQELLGVPVRWIGCGAGRLDMIDRGEGWDMSSSAATAGHDKNETPTTSMAEEKEGGGGKVVINFNGPIYLGKEGHE